MPGVLLPNFQEKNEKHLFDQYGSSMVESNIKLLKTEAEKIRIWNLQGDLRRQELERAVHDLTITVESQRKSLLEVQMEGEAVSTKMHEEIGKRSICLQKIDSTRELCNLLKSQVYDLSDTLKLCEGYKEMIASESMETKMAINELSVDFKNLFHTCEKRSSVHEKKLVQAQENVNKLTATHAQELEEIKAKLEECKELRSRYQLESSVLAEKLAEEQEVMIKQGSEYREKIASCEKQINANELHMQMLQKECNETKVLLEEKKNKLKEVEESLETQEGALLDLKEKLGSEQAKSEQLHASSNNEINKLEKLVEQKSIDLKISGDNLEAAMKEKNDTEKEFKAKLREMQQQHKVEVKELKALNKKGSAEILEQMDEQQSKMSELRSNLEKRVKELLQQLKELKSVKKQEVGKLNAQVKLKEQEIEKLQKDAKVSMENLVKDKQAELETVQKALEQRQVSLENLQKQYDDLTKNQADDTDKMLSMKQQNLSLTKTLKEFELEKERYGNECGALKLEVETGARKISELEKDRSKLQKMLDDKNSTSTSNEKNLENNLTTVNKELAELKISNQSQENEICRLKSLLQKKESVIVSAKEDAGSIREELAVKEQSLVETKKYYNQVKAVRKEQDEVIGQMEMEIKILKSELLKKSRAPEKLSKSSKNNMNDRVYTEVENLMNLNENVVKKQKLDDNHFNNNDILSPSPTKCIQKLELGEFPKHSTPKHRYGRREQALIQMKSATPRNSAMPCKSVTPRTEKRKKPVWKKTPSKTSNVIKPSKQAQEVDWFDTDSVYGFFG
uniref:synaptonemal complex protein 1-like n=1 Tax=Ciona intestinalis TaxID=7719 RepID=UPI000521C00B|nr:synaptonemal complex protein 1-like [Ciona intestinalis]|eukprot:XP_009859485.1 synaptonemal complex protein 1-like [Ciona intestinalis]